MAGAVLLRVIEGGAAEPRVAFASAPELPGVLSLDRIPPPRSGWSTIRIALAAIISMGLHIGLIAWGLQHRPDEEARATGGSNDSVITEGISVVLVDSLPSDASDGAAALPEAKQVAAVTAMEPVDDRAVPVSVVATVMPEAADTRAAALPDNVRPVEAAPSVAAVGADDAAVTPSAVAIPAAKSETAAASADAAPSVAADSTLAAIDAGAPVAPAGDATIAPDVSQAARAVADERAVAREVRSARPVDDEAVSRVVTETAIAKPDAEPARPIDDDTPAPVNEAKVASVADDAKPVSPIETPQPVAEAQPKPKPAATKPPPKPAPRSQQRAASVAEDAARAPAAGTAGAGGVSNEERGRASMSGYQSQLAAHLRRYRSFPEEARKRGMSGVATVRFTVNAAGAVTAAALAGSSGEGVLDSAALAMVRRASPFPPIPGNLGVSVLTVNVPVRFDLR